jgi:hypothetical protein
VRRRIVLALMLAGRAEIVTGAAALLLSFVNLAGPRQTMGRMAVLAGGLVILYASARSAWLDRHLSNAITRALRRWTKIDARDYVTLLGLSGDYAVMEIGVGEGDWLAGRPLAELDLPAEGVLVLGINRADGTYVGAPTGGAVVQRGDTLVLYGRSQLLAELDTRRAGDIGERAHRTAVAQQQRLTDQAQQNA